jgi:hypothetical protein
METVHHRPIKKFSLDGVIQEESALWRLKDEYIRLLESEMRISGYARRLDINADFTLNYNEQKNHFNFELTLYGVYVGKKKSQWITGIDETKVIYIQKNKSNEFSQVAE